MQTPKPNIAGSRSIKVEVEAGKAYSWCACGLSQSQPFCDGSHMGTSFKPITYQASESQIVSFCACKYSAKGPICDGTHKMLKLEESNA